MILLLRTLAWLVSWGSPKIVTHPDKSLTKWFFLIYEGYQCNILGNPKLSSSGVIRECLLSKFPKLTISSLPKFISYMNIQMKQKCKVRSKDTLAINTEHFYLSPLLHHKVHTRTFKVVLIILSNISRKDVECRW